VRQDAFGPRQVDALQELASIGCGQAITALGKLAGRRFEMDVPEAWVGAETGAIASFLGALGQDILAVGVKLVGRLRGDLLLALPERDAEALAAILGFPVGGGEAGWSGMAESALLESGNIVGSAFVSAVAALVQEKLLLSVPSLARGSARSCIEALVAHSGSVALATRFSCHGHLPGLEGLILVMPDPEGIAALVGHLLAEEGD
jgi:chemotaxis protein CheC